MIKVDISQQAALMDAQLAEATAGLSSDAEDDEKRPKKKGAKKGGKKRQSSATQAEIRSAAEALVDEEIKRGQLSDLVVQDRINRAVIEERKVFTKKISELQNAMESHAESMAGRRVVG